MITSVKPNTWKNLQDKVSEILSDCGFHTETEKKIKLARGSKEIDVYAEENIDSRKYTIIIECKYWKSNINQDIIHGFRSVASDLGCNMGYVITTSNFQKGAIEAIEHTNIKLLTWQEFQLNFFDIWYSKYFCKSIRNQLSLEIDFYLVDWFDLLDDTDKSLFFYLRNIIIEIEEVKYYFVISKLKDIGTEYSIPKLPLFDNLFEESNYYGTIPKEILNEETYLEFLDRFLEFGNDIFYQFKNLDKKYRTLL